MFQQMLMQTWTDTKILYKKGGCLIVNVLPLRQPLKYQYHPDFNNNW